MPVTVNKVIEESSRPDPLVVVQPAKNFAVSTASVGSEKRLSAHEQTAALSQRYEEAGLKVSVNFQTVEGHLVYIVKDRESGDVIRQIPSEEALRISKHLDRLTGIMLDKSVE